MRGWGGGHGGPSSSWAWSWTVLLEGCILQGSDWNLGWEMGRGVCSAWRLCCGHGTWLGGSSAHPTCSSLSDLRTWGQPAAWGLLGPLESVVLAASPCAADGLGSCRSSLSSQLGCPEHPIAAGLDDSQAWGSGGGRSHHRLMQSC